VAFKKDLAVGEQGEQIFKEHMETLGFYSKKKHGKFPEYDFQCKSGETRFIAEVKFDVMANKTGNIAIEVWNSKLDKPSGITVTKADVWVQVLSKDMVLIGLVSTLKDLVTYIVPHKVVEFGGDKNASLALYRINFLINTNVFYILNNMTSDDFTRFLNSREVDNAQQKSA